MPALEAPSAPSAPSAPAAIAPGAITAAYDRALAKKSNEPKKPAAEKAEAAPAEKAAPFEVKAEPVKAEAVKEPAKEAPKSALDAALDAKPKVDAPPADDDALKSFDEKNPDWKRARSVMGDQGEQIKKLRGEVETAKKAALDSETPHRERIASAEKELADIRAENAKLRDAIVAVNVELDPQVHDKFIAGRAKQLEKNAARVKEFGGDAEAYVEAMQMPIGKRRTEALRAALSDMDEFDVGTIRDGNAKIDALDEEFAELKKDPQQAWAALEKAREQESAAHREQSQKEKQAVFERVRKALPEKSPLFAEVDPSLEGAEEWNAGVKQAHERALYLTGPDASREEIMEAAMTAGRYEAVEKMFLTERTESRAEIAKLREQIAKYEDTEPGFNGAQKPKDGYQSPVDKWKAMQDKRRQSIV